MRLPLGALAHFFHTLLLAVGILARLVAVDQAHAHEEHDHADKPTGEAGSLVSPRVVAVSERYQFVGIVEGEVLVIYLDRAEDNAPVTTATIEVSLNGEPFKAELQEKAGRRVAESLQYWMIGVPLHAALIQAHPSGPRLKALMLIPPSVVAVTNA